MCWTATRRSAAGAPPWIARRRAAKKWRWMQRWAGCWPGMSAPRWMCRPSTAPTWTASRCAPPTASAPARKRPRCCSSPQIPFPPARSPAASSRRASPWALPPAVCCPGAQMPWRPSSTPIWWSAMDSAGSRCAARWRRGAQSLTRAPIWDRAKPRSLPAPGSAPGKRGCWRQSVARKRPWCSARWWRCSPPATRLCSRGRRCVRGRSMTATAAFSPMRCASSAARRIFSARSPTTNPHCAARCTPRCAAQIWCCSRAAPQRAKAI